MDMTTAQRATLKAFILADPTLSVKAAEGDYGAVSDGLNATASPAFPVWRRDTPTEGILRAVVWANMTPAQAIPTTPQLDVLVWQAKALACQGKQFNLQNMTVGRSTLPTQDAASRAGLQDSLTGLPSKSDGTTQAAGWSAIQTLIQRNATVAEKALVTSSTGGGGNLGWEGTIQAGDIGGILS